MHLLKALILLEFQRMMKMIDDHIVIDIIMNLQQ